MKQTFTEKIITSVRVVAAAEFLLIKFQVHSEYPENITFWGDGLRMNPVLPPTLKDLKTFGIDQWQNQIRRNVDSSV